jgi:dTDP-4-amino-4,6-dideoxygalactose transaminase
MVLGKSPSQIRIPLNRPGCVGPEWAYIRDALRRGQLSGDGYYTQRCSRHLEQMLQVPRVLLTSSGTHALEMAFLLLEAAPGEEVICPSFTFPSTANAFVLRGLRPRFVDIRPDTLNLDESLVEEVMTRRTVAIVPVHYAGVPAQMDVLVSLARHRGVMIVEDAAQALGARFRGQLAGTFGALNAFSFHETKNCMCGEGGALVITERRYIRRAEIIRQKGTNRDQFLRGEVDKYTWVDEGSSYVPSELQTAYLMAQLEHLDRITEKRRRLYERYREGLADLERRGILQLPRIPAECRSSYHLFRVLLESPKEARRALDVLHRKGIYAAIHYVPLHLSAMGKRFGYRRGDFPVTERVSGRLIRLPMYNSMRRAEQLQVLRALHDLF